METQPSHTVIPDITLRPNGTKRTNWARVTLRTFRAGETQGSAWSGFAVVALITLRPRDRVTWGFLNEGGFRAQVPVIHK